MTNSGLTVLSPPDFVLTIVINVARNNILGVPRNTEPHPRARYVCVRPPSKPAKDLVAKRTITDRTRSIPHGEACGWSQDRGSRVFEVAENRHSFLSLRQWAHNRGYLDLSLPGL